MVQWHFTNEFLKQMLFKLWRWEIISVIMDIIEMKENGHLASEIEIIIFFLILEFSVVCWGRAISHLFYEFSGP